MRESTSHSSRVRHAPRFRFTGPSEKPLCEYRVAPGMAMTVGMTMVLPSSHRLKHWGRLCQNGSWGETPVRRCSKPPLDDFPGFGLHTGRRGQIVCDTYLTVNAEMANRQKPTVSRNFPDGSAVRCVLHTSWENNGYLAARAYHIRMRCPNEKRTAR